MFIKLSDIYSNDKYIINISTISVYTTAGDSTNIELTNGKIYEVEETIDQIDKALREMYVTIKEIPNDTTGTSSSIGTETSEVSRDSSQKE